MFLIDTAVQLVLVKPSCHCRPHLYIYKMVIQLDKRYVLLKFTKQHYDMFLFSCWLFMTSSRNFNTSVFHDNIITYFTVSLLAVSHQSVS